MLVSFTNCDSRFSFTELSVEQRAAWAEANSVESRAQAEVAAGAEETAAAEAEAAAGLADAARGLSDAAAAAVETDTAALAVLEVEIDLLSQVLVSSFNCSFHASVLICIINLFQLHALAYLS